MTTRTPLGEHYKRILHWVHFYPVPPDGFDALRADERTLASYGVPARPAVKPDDAVLLRFWERMIGPGTRFERPTFPDGTEPLLTTFALQRREPERREAGRRTRGFHHRSNSRNWSGACITPTRPNRFVHVTGAWTVPDLGAPRVPPPGASELNGDYRSSTWIGLGGHRPYNSLPQIGTGQHLDVSIGDHKSFFAWWQWWVVGRPEHHVPMPIMNFPVSAGDRMLAMVTVEASRDVVFHLKNETSGLFVTFKVVAPAGIETLGASAEWVHERPTEFGSDRMYPMPRFEAVTFTDCRAISAPERGGAEIVQNLVGARLIRMTDRFADPHRSALVSVPSSQSDEAFVIDHAEAMPR